MSIIRDVRGKARSTRQHASCGKIRQQGRNIEWQSYMANVAVKKALGRRA